MGERDRQTILLVEDEAIIAMAAAKTIRSFGHEVIVAPSGEIAVETARGDEAIGLILMDIDLGKGIDGPEAARRILETRDLPIVFLTSHPEKEYVDRVRALRRYGYVIKNSGDFVLQSSIEMAFALFDAHRKAAGELRERARAEKALKESELKYRSLIEGSSDVIFCVDRNGEYKFANKVLASAFGKTPEHFVGKTYWDIYSKEHADFRQAATSKVFETGESSSTEVLVPLKDEIRTYLARISPIKDEGGEVVLALVHSTDITERKRAEEALRESELVYEDIFQTVSEGIVHTTLSGKVISVNKSLERMLDIPKELSVGKNILRLVEEYLPAKKTAVVIPLISRLIQGMPIRTFQVEYKDRLLEVDATINKRTGRLTGVIRDITERKAAEEKIAALLSEKELLLHEVHHRIKNNMGAMMSLLSLQAEAVQDPTASAALKDAENRLRSMNVLYNRLYRSDNLREMPIGDYLPPLVDEIVGMFPENARVKTRIEVEAFRMGVADLSNLGMIVNELLTNIMKYAFAGRDGGSILVAASKRGDRAVVIVGDDGIGIPESVDIDKSTGFGLMLVGALAKQMAGTLRIDREKGTRIILEFPL